MTNQVVRQRSIGIAREDDATKGTAVAIATGHFASVDSGILEAKAEPYLNESSAGRIEAGLETFAAKEWSELSFSAPVKTDWLGHVLTGLLGSVSSSNAAGETTVREHTITVNSAASAPAYTFFMLDPISTGEKGAYGTFNKLELKCDADGVLMADVTGIAKALAAATGTAAFSTDYHLQGSHCAIKMAAATADVAATSAIGFKSLTLTIERDVTPQYAFGSNTPSSFIAGALRITGQLELLRSSTTYRDYFTDGTSRAMTITFNDTATTIGSAETPSLIFTLDKIQVTGHKITEASDDVDIETIDFQACYDLDEDTPRMIQVVMTNMESATAYTEPA